MAIEHKLKRGRPPKERNEVTSELLATGEATMSQLAQLFETDAKTLPRRLHGIRPSGVRNNASTFKIREAASRLVKPGYAIEQYLQRMHPNELPVGLMKEFWAGQKSRQEYEIKAGDLWPTAQVIEGYAEAFKTARMTILLMPETVERETGVTDAQRRVLRRLTDGLIEELREALVERFKNYVPRTRPADLPSFAGLEPGEDGDGVFSAEGDEEDPDDL